MSELGHSRRFGDVRDESAYPLTAARKQTFENRRSGPGPEVKFIVGGQAGKLEGIPRRDRSRRSYSLAF
jgi:hypothetical protein